ncbi:hypothetical protein PSP6_80104 [Paraburkholderia tropica]|nr:hypothetical protein PSP6_80104 [Paraburkholderia tropica]
MREQPAKYRLNVLSAQPLSDFDGECLAAEDVYDRQRSHTGTIGQLIGHEAQTSVGTPAASEDHSDPRCGSRPVSSARAGSLFCGDILRDRLVQAELRNQLFEPRILVLKLLQFADLIRFQVHIHHYAEECSSPRWVGNFAHHRLSARSPIIPKRPRVPEPPQTHL